MSTYRRFVTYLFQYEGNEKKANSGFAKVEVRQDKCRMELQIKGAVSPKLQVYLFARREGVPVGSFLGELTTNGGAGMVVYMFPTAGIGDTPYGMDDMRGLYIVDTDAVFFASQWDDEVTDWAAFHVYEPEKESAEAVTAAAEAEIESVNTQKPRPEEEQPSVQEMPPEGKKELHATQVTTAMPSGICNSFARTWGQQWERFTAAHPIFHPFDGDLGTWGVKLDLRDFKMMPKAYRPLVNNSFLLHGYFNYHYILFGYKEEEKEKWFLGVPGVFQNQEQLLAGFFGFPEFRTKQECVQKTGEFGYWYRFLDL